MKLGQSVNRMHPGCDIYENIKIHLAGLKKTRVYNLSEIKN
jgi:hypothetical protein